MLDKAIITASSSKFFPSLINLIGSIKKNYPNHPKIFVYDIGLLKIFVKELELIDRVEILRIPKFSNHWRSCYTWKTYIFANPRARLNFYLDAGCEVLKSLDDIFSTIENDDMLLIDQGQSFKKIVPESYKSIFNLDDRYDSLTTVHAGIIGFKAVPKISEIIKKIYDSAYAGLALGFSPKESWRNKGKDKNIFVRDCEMFRHDLTLVNIFFRKFFNKDINVHSAGIYAGGPDFISGQYIWQMRLNYTGLNYLKTEFLHENPNPVAILNRVIINLMIIFKRVNLLIKRRLSIIKI